MPGVSDAAGEFRVDVFGQACQLCLCGSVLNARSDPCPEFAEGDLQRLTTEDRGDARPCADQVSAGNAHCGAGEAEQVRSAGNRSRRSASQIN